MTKEKNMKTRDNETNTKAGAPHASQNATEREQVREDLPTLSNGMTPDTAPSPTVTYDKPVVGNGGTPPDTTKAEHEAEAAAQKQAGIEAELKTIKVEQDAAKAKAEAAAKAAHADDVDLNSKILKATHPEGRPSDLGNASGFKPMPDGNYEVLHGALRLGWKGENHVDAHKGSIVHLTAAEATEHVGRGDVKPA